jgi:UDP-2-acetamido-2-deoxy-ribo-hexuluronate aminotransferase
MMDKITMVDLHGQYLSIKDQVDAAIQQVIDKTSFINGPQVKEFCGNLEKYLDARHIVPCANGTDALQIALMALGLKPGDEVITPDFTFIATVEVVALLGLKPVLVDVDAETFNIDPQQVKKAITNKTKAIVPVHLFGLCAKMAELTQIAKEHNLFLIEDNAQALGANYCDDKLSGKAGIFGDVGCTSFFPSKILGCFGDGGAIMTNDDKLAEKMRCIANHGAKIKYYHDEIGINSRLDTLQAAILNVKLKYISQFIDARQKAATYYTNKLSTINGIETPVIPKYSDHVFHQYTIKVKTKRDALKEFLESKGIPSMIYYPVPMHRQKVYQMKGSYPVSDMLAASVLSLPMHTELTTDQLDYICEQIQIFFK